MQNIVGIDVKVNYDKANSNFKEYEHRIIVFIKTCIIQSIFYVDNIFNHICVNIYYYYYYYGFDFYFVIYFSMASNFFFSNNKKLLVY